MKSISRLCTPLTGYAKTVKLVCGGGVVGLDSDYFGTMEHEAHVIPVVGGHLANAATVNDGVLERYAVKHYA